MYGFSALKTHFIVVSDLSEYNRAMQGADDSIAPCRRRDFRSWRDKHHG
jgi:hypothetical protein